MIVRGLKIFWFETKFRLIKGPFKTGFIVPTSLSWRGASLAPLTGRAMLAGA
jgi:hypothetical protein